MFPTEWILCSQIPEAFLPLLEINDEESKIELTKEVMDFITKVIASYNEQIDTETVHEVLTPIFKEKNMIKTIFEEKFLEGKIEGRTEGKN